VFRKKQKQTQSLGRQRLTQQPATRGSVFSYHASRSIRVSNVGREQNAQEQPLKRQRRKRWWHKLSNLMLLALVALLLVVSLGLNGNPRVVVAGDRSSKVFLRNPSVYQAAARHAFAGSPLNSNKVTVDTSHITQELHSQFPELAAVSIQLPIIGHQPVVYIQPATPRLVLTTQTGGAFVIDHSGRAVISTKQIAHPQDLEVPTVSDQSDLQIKVGEIALDSASVSFISEVANQLKAKGVTVNSLALSSGGSQLDVKVNGAPYTVKFNIGGSAREEAGTFLAVKQQLEAEHKQPGQYIDVRVSGRAYYK
jgi:hypothetical protein